MKDWITCETCGEQKSKLWVGCKFCGSGMPLPERREGSCITSSADWKEINVHDQWRANFERKGIIPGEVRINSHALCEHSLLLRKLGADFNSFDLLHKFDDIWFFLRGGYPYFAYLNRNSRMTFRATIFEGLARPEDERVAFLSHVNAILRRAEELNIRELDIAVIDEVESGSGMNALAKIIRENTADLQRAKSIAMRIHRIMIKQPGRPVDELLASLKSAPIIAGGVIFSFDDKVYEGTMLAYDNPYLLGMQFEKTTRELHLVMYSAQILSFFCPISGLDVHWSAPGVNDIPTLVGNYAIDLASQKSDFGINSLRRGLKKSQCATCNKLEAQL